jgi:predicted RNA-binding Zn-ribbon protein involved in translation (DUF1610 family)
MEETYYNRKCIVCNQLIEDEDYYTDISMGTYWCSECGAEELERRKELKGEI